MQGIVDRIEGDMAVVEIGESMVDILLPEEFSVREGDLVTVNSEQTKILSVDVGAGRSRQRYIESLFERLKR